MVPGHVHARRKSLPCLTINGACSETRLENSVPLLTLLPRPSAYAPLVAPFPPLVTLLTQVGSFPPLRQSCLSARYASRVKPVIFLFYWLNGALMSTSDSGRVCALRLRKERERERIHGSGRISVQPRCHEISDIGILEFSSGSEDTCLWEKRNDP